VGLYTIETPQGANGGTLKINKEGETYGGTIINSRMLKRNCFKEMYK
jgi:hypothetical protein